MPCIVPSIARSIALLIAASLSSGVPLGSSSIHTSNTPLFRQSPRAHSLKRMGCARLFRPGVVSILSICIRYICADCGSTPNLGTARIFISVASARLLRSIAPGNPNERPHCLSFVLNQGSISVKSLSCMPETMCVAEQVQQCPISPQRGIMPLSQLLSLVPVGRYSPNLLLESLCCE